MVDHFINRFNKLRSKQILDISDDVLTILMHYSFPGNIRELENIIEYAFILCHDNVIELQHLPEQFHSTSTDGLSPVPQSLTLEAITKQAVEAALKRNDWKRLATARELSVDKGTLRRMIARYQIQTP